MNNKRAGKYFTTAFILAVLSLTYRCFSQNLVPNPSFEEYFSCPKGENQLHLCKYWFNPAGGTPDYYNKCVKKETCTLRCLFSIPYNATGYQYAKTGNAYVGIINIGGKNFTIREYIGTRLLKPLETGRIYKVSMYVSLADSSQCFYPCFGFCFSKVEKLPRKPKVNKYELPICDNGILVCDDILKADTANWRLIEGQYLAKGEEEYLMIGLFDGYIKKAKYRRVKRRNKTARSSYLPYAYYYIDDVAVEEKK